jgi:NitT/TauT family transport system ATP-binding protein
VSLTIGRGQIVSVVGPSGCGKSTLLSLIAGLREPTQGAVRWHNSAGDEPDARSSRLFTMVFQKDTLLPWLSVRSNVAFGLRYVEMSDSARKERLSWLLELGGLTEFAQAYPYQLSGGMRRRVAFLAAIAPLPKVLLLDEPFSALDEPTRVELHNRILAIVYELGMSVFLATHDLGEAVSLSDEVHILTRRPARVADTHLVGFGHDRDVLAIRETEEYLGLYRELWSGLRRQIKPSEASDHAPASETAG